MRYRSSFFLLPPASRTSPHPLAFSQATAAQTSPRSAGMCGHRVSIRSGQAPCASESSEDPPRLLCDHDVQVNPDRAPSLPALHRAAMAWICPRRAALVTCHIQHWHRLKMHRAITASGFWLTRYQIHTTFMKLSVLGKRDEPLTS